MNAYSLESLGCMVTRSSRIILIFALFAIAINQQERYGTTHQRQKGASSTSTIPTITQTFYPGPSATNNIASQQTHPNVSYHAMPPETGTNVNYTLQVPGVATTRVNISHSENESTLVYNHAYETARGSGLYEELDCA